jgi:hypothetical protein
MHCCKCQVDVLTLVYYLEIGVSGTLELFQFGKSVDGLNLALW